MDIQPNLCTGQEPYTVFSLPATQIVYNKFATWYSGGYCVCVVHVEVANGQALVSIHLD